MKVIFPIFTHNKPSTSSKKNYKDSKHFYNLSNDIYEPNKILTKEIPIQTTDEELYKQQKINIAKFVSKECDMKLNLQFKTIKKLREMFEEGIEPSYLEMLMELVQNKKISYYTLKFFEKNDSLRDEVKKDLDLLYEAYATNKNAKDVFCPTFQDKKEALKKLKIGEVGEIRGKKGTFTKLPNGSIRNLAISKETYLKLFPPVEKFSIIQSESGDCTLLATIDAIFSNPNTRHIILEMFYEDKKGNLNVNVNGWRDEEGKFIKENVLVNSALYDIEKILKKRLKHAKDFNVEQFEAARIIEILYAYNTKEKNLNEIIKIKDNISGIFGEEALQFFDLHGRIYKKCEKEELEKLFSDKDFSKKYICIAGSDHKLINDKIEEGHAYSIQPCPNEKKIIVRNPYNTSRNIVLTMEEYFKYFIETFVANINTRDKNLF